MFVSSLKSQMVLLQNPTDFWYSSFFIQYGFVITIQILNFALNSTIVLNCFRQFVFFYSRWYAVARLRFAGRSKIHQILIIYMV